MGGRVFSPELSIYFGRQVIRPKQLRFPDKLSPTKKGQVMALLPLFRHYFAYAKLGFSFSPGFHFARRSYKNN